MTAPEIKLLVVEDNAGDADLIREYLAGARGFRFQMELAASLGEARLRVTSEPFDLVLLDLGLPDCKGMATFEAMYRTCPRVPIVVLTGLEDEEVGLEAIRQGAQDYLLKRQINSALLVRAVRYALERKKAEGEVRRLNAELEQRVHNRTAELEASNKELEALTYTVAHDLRAPLRAIDGFSQILLKEYAALLPADAQRYLHLNRQNVQRMDQLVDGLLTFARLHRQVLQKRTVDTGALVRQVVDARRERQPERKIEITIRDLPGCTADPALLKQVFTYLLDNAFKFTRRCATARIEVGAYPDPNRSGGHVYFVKDNGVGFDMQYVHKLFGVFQRLHRTEDYPGTGVGLAVVQRIVHRHGGRIWAEGAVDQGATFSFTLEGGSLHD